LPALLATDSNAGATNPTRIWWACELHHSQVNSDPLTNKGNGN